MERAKVIFVRDGTFEFEDHVTRVDPVVHVHRRDTCDGLTFDDGTLDRRGTAVLRQKRTVRIDTAVFRIFQHIRRQDLAVRNDNDEVGIEFLQGFLKCAVLQRLRLPDRNAVFFREHLDRRGDHLHAASLRLIRLGHGADHVHAFLFVHRPQAFRREIRRSHKQHSHSTAPPLFSVVL